MSKEKRSVLEEALSEIQLMKESLQGNSKDIFRSVMKEEIEGIVESALNEDDYEEEDIDSEEETDVDSVDVSTDVDDVDSGAEGEEGMEDTPAVTGTDDVDVDAIGGDSEFDAPEGDNDMDFGGDELDLTTASDEEVIKAYKKLSNTDEIEVVGDEVTIKDSDSGNEYVIKMGGSTPAPATAEVEPEMTDDMESDDMGETMYEITLSEESEEDENLNEGEGAHGDYPTATNAPSGNIEGQKAPLDSDTGDNLEGGFDETDPNSGDAHGEHIMEEEGEGKKGKAYGPQVKNGTYSDDMTKVNPKTSLPAEEISETEEIDENEETLEEAIPEGTAESRRVAGRNTPVKGPGAKENTPSAVSENAQLYKEAMKGYISLKNENKIIKEAFTEMKKHLQGALLYNQNLTHIVKLFTENTTTRNEKAEIVKKFDGVSNITESKKLYESYISDLKDSKIMVENKINSKTVGSGSSSKLVEKTAYQKENSRIMDLMERVEGKKML